MPFSALWRHFAGIIKKEKRRKYVFRRLFLHCMCSFYTDFFVYFYLYIIHLLAILRDLCLCTPNYVPVHFVKEIAGVRDIIIHDCRERRPRRSAGLYT